MSNFLEAVDYQSEGASEAFVKSLHETGFGVLKKSSYCGSSSSCNL
jgi:hypothetical protein